MVLGKGKVILTITKDKPIRMTGKEYYEALQQARKEGAKVERERIVKIVQGLLYEAESNAVEKPEYYDDVYLYKGIIDLIAADQGQGHGQE